MSAPTFAPLIYFFSGVVSTLLALYMLASKEQAKAKRDKRPWTRINSLKWNFNFDYAMKGSMNAHEVATLIAASAAQLIQRDYEKNMLNTTTIEPGDYSIRMHLGADFVKREP